MYLSLSGLGLFFHGFFLFSIDCRTFWCLSMSVYSEWKFHWNFRATRTHLLGKNAEEEEQISESIWSVYLRVCVYEFVSVCAIWFVAYRRCHFHLSMVWQIHRYLNFNLTMEINFQIHLVREYSTSTM